MKRIIAIICIAFVFVGYGLDDKSPISNYTPMDTLEFDYIPHLMICPECGRHCSYTNSWGDHSQQACDICWFGEVFGDDWLMMDLFCNPEEK